MATPENPVTHIHPVFVHDRALCESDDIGAGTRVWPFAHVMAGARVGSGCNIGEQAFVEGGVTIGDRVTVKNGVMIWDGVTVEDEVFLGPGAVFTNDLMPRIGHRVPDGQFVRTVVRKGASIGANATIVCGVTIGRYALVGAGAVVTRDVPDHALVVGNPARLVGWVCECGQRLDSDLACGCGTSYARDAEGALTALTKQVVIK